jgi:hypothetical protein
VLVADLEAFARDNGHSQADPKNVKKKITQLQYCRYMISPFVNLVMATKSS